MKETIHDRIRFIALENHISIRHMERLCNLKRTKISQALSKKSDVSHRTIHQIITTFPQYSLDWLILGHKRRFIINSKK